MNSRCWAAEQEAADNDQVSRVVRSQAELESALGQFTSEEAWLLKMEFSMSGRDRLTGTGSQLTEAQSGWVRKRLKSDQPLILEKRLEGLQELGAQFGIPSSGTPVFSGLVPMLTDTTGRYAGSWLLDPQQLIDGWQTTLNQLENVCLKLQQSGYFGRVGIDVMQYRSADGRLKMRLYQDVNARFTMGYLTCWWRRYLQPGEVGCWLHLGKRCESKQKLSEWWEAKIDQCGAEGCRLIRTAPLMHAGEIVQHQTGLLIAANEQLAREQVQRLLAPEN
ncbi:MAG: hypothetical protein R3C11_03280 [Planctomycetaceae bacterium]